ncbi:YggS family pyridoxal phosphate-dependent enzyme [Paraferrimonas haliotis]|uniref:Pyridoxal phosphate homeostasis protein n=1 Tax=Paraferrimonas haliotis TaxID=2013866 RepID=A0AA37TSX7_9GAMM|nr:YggS family pyridoxal phosphate-dependent enzyme [Paraferrimonas haliotis]GLS83637.1 YggS family pyridoxal phosphate enzyme [Paraferrimonas haliotis]
MTTITDRYTRAQSQIIDACQNCNRQPQSVTLLAVSKTKPINDIQALYDIGHRQFGENYVQEGVEKVQALAKLDIDWHFIGPIQSNKTALVAQHFDWVQTIDRMKIAQRLNNQRPAELGPLNVLIQVNISQEATKSGVALESVDALAEEIAQLPNLRLRGLMAIPAAAQTLEQQTQEYQAMQSALSRLQSQYPSIDTLSIGMSGDMTQAIANGSTMVRIGTAIFGAREQKG